MLNLSLSMLEQFGHLVDTRCSINKLESVQRHAAHFVTSDYYMTSSVSAMLSYLKWNKIEIQNKEVKIYNTL